MSRIPKRQNSDVETLLEYAQPVNTRSYSSFLRSFPLQGEALYLRLFENHPDLIQTQKAKFAVANLQKLMNATFAISSTSGFDRMSLRDLSRKTGMSMGAIYSCISKKEDIVLMAADVVRESINLTNSHALQYTSNWQRIKESIRFHLYTSTLLQPWYFFLYFETRCLSKSQQIESKNLELKGIEKFQKIVDEGVNSDEFHCQDSRAIANAIVLLLEDWYLKPWKHRRLTSGKNGGSDNSETQINRYFQSTVTLVSSMLQITASPTRVSTKVSVAT